jgi:hypothetical protein
LLGHSTVAVSEQAVAVAVAAIAKPLLAGEIVTTATPTTARIAAVVARIRIVRMIREAMIVVERRRCLRRC